LQFFLVFLPQIALISLIFDLPINVWLRISSASIVVTAGYVIDALTVRLAAAKR